MVDESTVPRERPASPEQPEAVIREARRRQRHRWVLAGIVAVAVVVLVLVATIVRLVSSRSSHAHGPTTEPPRIEKPLPARPAGVRPTQPGPLAVGPGGALYIADDAQNRILARLPSGQFRVIAGDGKAGFSGDGGPAVDAELDEPEGITVGSNGTIYFADSFNNRIRAVWPEGTITTVAGNGQRPTSPATPISGTPAVEAAISQPEAVAIGPEGSVYFAESADILQIQPDGDLSIIDDAGTFTSFDPPLMLDQQCYPASLAFGGSGNLYIGCSSPWVLLVQTANGTLRSLGTLRPHDAWAALTNSPEGGVFAIYGASVAAYGSATPPPTANFLTYDLPGGSGFWPQGIAVTAGGTLYLAQDGVSGIGSPAIVQEAPNGRLTVLWQARAPTGPTR
jgi:hypothetical protein